MKKIALIFVLLSSLLFNLAAQQSADMVRINGGTFTMGSPASEPGRGATSVRTRVLPLGATSTRATGTTSSASGWLGEEVISC